MITLKELRARQVLDSRGRPTVEVDAIASTGALGRAIVPSGASTGRHEAHELRDPESPRHGGLGVLKAVHNVTAVIAPAVIGRELDDQRSLDGELLALDGTPNKGRLGANALLGVSLAVARAAAAARGEELLIHLNRLWRERLEPGDRDRERIASSPTLPLPMVNMISGGLRAGRNLDIQDVLIIPVGAESYSQALEMSVAMYRAVGGAGRARSGISTRRRRGGGSVPSSATMSMPWRLSSMPWSPAASSRVATWGSPSTLPRAISSTPSRAPIASPPRAPRRLTAAP